MDTLRNSILAMSITIAAFLSSAARAQFTITRNTVDGGGVMNSTGGNFSLGGTIGQHDAGPESGPLASGTYSLVGGFWPVTQVCACLGDMNGDGQKNGQDVQLFVQCQLVGGTCSCADVDTVNGVTIDDVEIFVADLLTGGACP
jgi:hypothetical protein